jgi:EmrB/QacA subfamily drug resistance transporter
VTDRVTRRGSATVARDRGRSVRIWTLALTSVAAFMVSLDALVVVTALPSMQRDLRADLSTLEWTVNAYTLAFAAGIVTAAALGDRFGRRRVFAGGLALFSVASAACALAPTPEALIAARAVQGLGAAVVTPLALTILASAFPAERRGMVLGLWGGITGLAVAGGPLVGGGVTQGLDWHWIFWVNVPIGVLATLLALTRLPESRGPASRLDPIGALLVTAGAVSIAWGLIRANGAGWGSGEVVGALGGGAVLIAGFILWERRAPAPMLPLELFRIRAFAAANATGFLMFGSIFSAAFLISQYFQFALGYSPVATGLRFLPWTATPIVIAPLAGALSDRIGRRPLMATGLFLQAGGLLWIAIHATTSLGYEQLVIPMVVAGIGISMAIPTTPTAALSAVAPQDMGKASGVQNTLTRFGSVFAVAVAGAVFAGSGHLGSASSFTNGFRPALTVVAGMSALGAVSALAVAERRRGAAEAQPEPAHAMAS